MNMPRIHKMIFTNNRDQKGVNFSPLATSTSQAGVPVSLNQFPYKIAVEMIKREPESALNSRKWTEHAFGLKTQFAGLIG